jgi:hypothetical protein
LGHNLPKVFLVHNDLNLHEGVLTERQMSRKALQDGEVSRYELKDGRPSPVLDPVKPIIDRWLAEDQDRPPKQALLTNYAYDEGCDVIVRDWRS